MVREEWQQRACMDFEQRLAEELAKIDEIEERCWDYLKQSEGQAVTRTGSRVECRPDGTPKRFTRYTEHNGRVADMRFMDRIAWCVEMRCKLLGLVPQPGPAVQVRADVVTLPGEAWDAIAGGPVEPTANGVEQPPAHITEKGD